VNGENAQEAAWAEIATYLGAIDAYEFQDLSRPRYSTAKATRSTDARSS
jgi:hypothetical protein